MKLFSDKSASSDYDPYHRNPQFCHAENSCIWELEMLAEHFHPTVSLFAKQILKVGVQIQCLKFICSNNYISWG